MARLTSGEPCDYCQGPEGARVRLERLRRANQREPTAPVGPCERCRVPQRLRPDRFASRTRRALVWLYNLAGRFRYLRHSLYLVEQRGDWRLYACTCAGRVEIRSRRGNYTLVEFSTCPAGIMRMRSERMLCGFPQATLCDR